MAVNCLDYPRSGDNASWEQGATAVMRPPTFNSHRSYPDAYASQITSSDSEACKDGRGLRCADPRGGGPPATSVTPYAWSEAPADQLETGQPSPEGHRYTAYVTP